MSELVSYQVDNGIAVLTVNNPPVNAINFAMAEGIDEGIRSAGADDSVVGIVLIGQGRTFIAGADIKDFDEPPGGEKKSRSNPHALLKNIEDSPKPIVCAIHGTALGGGLEYAVACHARIALDSAMVGHPEVKLGLIPGAAGTQRLPRLAGLPKAVEMCAFGEMVGAAEAKTFGIVDRLVTGDLLAKAKEFARQLAVSEQPLRKTSELSIPVGDPAAEAAAMTRLRAQVIRKSRGGQAPIKALEAVEAAAKLPYSEGIKMEREIFETLVDTVESLNCIHVFFGERTVRKIPDVPSGTETFKIEKAAVIGAGTMGGGIAMAYVNAGIPVVLKEVSQDRLDYGMNAIKRNYEISARRGRLTGEEVKKRLDLIEPTLNYDDIGSADIVVEAVFEEMNIKKQVFREIDQAAAPNAILASNTSTLDIDEIASATGRPQMVIGTHFFSPANIMKLIEIVRGRKSKKEVVATCMALARRLGKIGVLVNNGSGFVGNRMFYHYERECHYMAEEGAAIYDIDKALTDFGMAMGVFALGDLVGLDIGRHVRKELEGKIPPGFRRTGAGDQLVKMGRLGQKANAGWYRYEPGGRKPLADPEVEKIIAQCAADAGIKQRHISSLEMLERPLYALVNEGARILEEGIALRSVDIDIIYVYGFAFPTHRGGPIRYADNIGLKKIYARICQFQKENGAWWQPAPLLKKLVDEGKTFADFDKERMNR